MKVMILLGVTGIEFDHQEQYFPKGTDKFKHYSSFSSVIELHDSFHQTLSFDKLEQLHDLTPDNFTFVGRMHKVVTLNPSKDNEEIIKRHFASFEALKYKMPMVTYNFDSRFSKNNKSIEQIENMLEISRKYYLGHLLLEFNNSSWYRYDEDVHELSKKYSCSLVNTDRHLVSHMMRDETIFYLRLVGDRSIMPTKHFGKKMMDKSKDLEYWTTYIKSLHKRHKFIYIIIDNHYSGDSISDCIFLASQMKKNNLKFVGFKEGKKNIP